MKSELVQAHAERRARVESGEQVIVGVNKHVESEPNPMLADLDSAIQAVDSAVAAQAVDGVVRWRAERDAGAVEVALAQLRAAADTDANLVPTSLACARVGVTTGEWADALREEGEAHGARAGHETGEGVHAARVHAVGQARQHRHRRHVADVEHAAHQPRRRQPRTCLRAARRLTDREAVRVHG